MSGSWRDPVLLDGRRRCWGRCCCGGARPTRLPRAQRAALQACAAQGLPYDRHDLPRKRSAPRLAHTKRSVAALAASAAPLSHQGGIYPRAATRGDGTAAPRLSARARSRSRYQPPEV